MSDSVYIRKDMAIFEQMNRAARILKCEPGRVCQAVIRIAFQIDECQAFLKSMPRYDMERVIDETLGIHGITSAMIHAGLLEVKHGRAKLTYARRA